MKLRFGVRAGVRAGIVSGIWCGMALVGITSFGLIFGCSSSSNSSSATPGTTGPKVPSEQLGQSCNGGTSPGDSVAFSDDSCKAGKCLVDDSSGTLDGLQVYCSADCSNAQCPDGYICKKTTLESTYDCFIDPNAPVKDGGSGGSTTSCTTLSGTYTETQTQTSGGSACLPGGTGGATFDNQDAGTGCTQSFDAASCTFTSDCTATDSATNLTVNEHVSVDTSTLIGTFSYTDSTNGSSTPAADCHYDITLAKK